MKELESLVQLLSGVKVSKLNVIGTDGASNTKVQRLYDQILAGKISSDQDGAEMFFPTGEFQEKYFGKLKRKLQDRLLNTFFFIDLDKPQFTEYQKANQVCHRNLLVVKLLLSYRQRNLAIMVARKTFKKAVYFDFTEIALLLAKELRTHYGSITGEKYKADSFNKLVKQYIEVYSAELKAEEYYSELMGSHIFSKSNKPELLEKAESFCKDLDVIFEKVDSFRFKFTSYLVYILRFETENNYRSTLNVCEKALEYFTVKKPFGPKSVVFHFYFKMISCHIQLQEYKKAKDAILTCLELVPEGDFNWYVTLELYFLVSLRSHNYQHAYDIYLNVVKQPNFKSQYQPIIERWKINEAFVHFLILKNQISPTEEDQKDKFRINKFLNEVPKHSKDKR
jgi:tetratricopeptide (TPR) repeat protein